MHRWRMRRSRGGMPVGALTPLQVQALRRRDARVGVWATRAFIGAAALASVFVASFAASLGAGRYNDLVMLGVGCALISTICLVMTWRGYVKASGLVTLVIGTLAILAMVAELSSAVSVESALFGMALMPFILVRTDETALRLGLTGGILGVYLVCEFAFPEAATVHDLTEAEIQMAGTFHRVVAAVLMIAVLTVMQIRLRLNRRILEGAARYGELRATTDELTGVFNRRPVIAALEEYAARGRANYAIALVDLDNFKQINDTYGHDCGDATIKLVAETLQKHFRESDMVSRWGGDEFLVLMPGMRHGDLPTVLERLRAELNSIPSPCGKDGLRVSVSIGAAMGVLGQSPDDCIAAADVALYRAKQAGRNRVETVGAGRQTAALGRPST